MVFFGIVLIVDGSINEIAKFIIVLTLYASCIGYGYIVDKDEHKPSAMDVYRGKTSLMIKTTDSITFDSTVVWKDGEKTRIKYE